MKLITVGDITFDERRQAARFLRGSGIEIGASHLPINIDRRCCHIKYVDRLTAPEIETLFPELHGYQIVPADIICDVAKEGLKPFDNESLDFIIASHLLEHVPNPLGLIKDCHRVLRNDGIFYLVVPDKNYTFDRDRERTPLSHIVQDMENKAINIDETHIVDFLVHVCKIVIPNDPEEKSILFRKELERGIHVHVWVWDDVVEILRHMIIYDGVTWELCEAYLPKNNQDEVIFILRKVKLSPEKAILQFNSNLEILIAREKAMEAAINMLQEKEKIYQDLSKIKSRIEELQTKVGELHGFYKLPIRVLRKIFKLKRR